MTKVIRNYLGALAVLPFLLAPTISGAFELTGFAVGVGFTGAAVEIVGTEKNPEGTSVSGKSLEEMQYPFVFGEARFNIRDRFGVTLGLDFIPGEADFVAESKADSDLDGTAGTTTTGTSTVNGTMKNHTTLYIQPTLSLTDVFSVYLSAGYVAVQVEADAKLVTSTNFVKRQVTNGTRLGAGVMAQGANGFFVKLEANATDYDDVSFTTSESTTVSANTDTEGASLLIGKAF